MSSDHGRESASQQAWHVGEVHQSIDSIIQWLRERRNEDPTVPLAEILKDKPLSREHLLELACIDLIGQRRVGRSVTVEDYLRDFAELRDDSARLDLIDAEICVDRELGKSPRLDELASRFADLRSQIGDLVEMDPLGHGALVRMPEFSDDHPKRSRAAETGLVGRPVVNHCNRFPPQRRRPRLPAANRSISRSRRHRLLEADRWPKHRIRLMFPNGLSASSVWPAGPDTG